MNQDSPSVNFEELSQIDHKPRGKKDRPRIPVDMDNLPEGRDTSKYGPKFIPLEQIIELRQRNLTFKQIGKLLDITDSAVAHRLKDHKATLEQTDNFIKHRSTILAFHQQKGLSKISAADYTIKTAKDEKDLAIAISKYHEMERLDRGQSTSNVSYADMTARQTELRKIAQEKREELDRLKAKVERRLLTTDENNEEPGIMDAEYLPVQEW